MTGDFYSDHGIAGNGPGQGDSRGDMYVSGIDILLPQDGWDGEYGRIETSYDKATLEIRQAEDGKKQIYAYQAYSGQTYHFPLNAEERKMVNDQMVRAWALTVARNPQTATLDNIQNFGRLPKQVQDACRKIEQERVASLALEGKGQRPDLGTLLSKAKNAARTNNKTQAAAPGSEGPGMR